jgi:murein DD-endopeptidase MepM/ murein hydrolase activator NlpD
MPAPGAALAATQAASQAAKSPALRYLTATTISAPVMLVVGLLLLLGGGVAAQAAAAPGAPRVLRPGVVPAQYEALVRQAALTCPGITAPLLAAQLKAESGWNPNGVSPVGAQGLAQFMPGTWTSEGVDGDGDGVRDPFDPADAIASQARFMCKLLVAVTADTSLTGDRIDLALASYNAGLGAVQRHNGVPPYAETQGYIVRIRSLMAKYADPATSAPGAGPPGTWVRPIAGPITSHYGQRWGRLHAGTDLAAPIGTPVYAASDGSVLAAGPANGYGRWVKLAHPGGIATAYGHINTWTVTVGQAVQAGQLIAYSGNEGRSTGPHLHFETHTAGGPVDPVAFYAAHGVLLQ